MERQGEVKYVVGTNYNVYYKPLRFVCTDNLKLF